MAEEAKILQIIPADGWSAQYEDEDSIPLVCFALTQAVDEEGKLTTVVRPMACVDTEVEFCDEYDNYLGVSQDDGDDDYEDDEE